MASRFPRECALTEQAGMQQERRALRLAVRDLHWHRDDAAIALSPGRFAHQVDLLATAAGLERRRLIEWTLAFAGLSAAWHVADGEPADLDLSVARLAAAAM